MRAKKGPVPSRLERLRDIKLLLGILALTLAGLDYFCGRR